MEKMEMNYGSAAFGISGKTSSDDAVGAFLRKGTLSAA